MMKSAAPTAVTPEVHRHSAFEAPRQQLPGRLGVGSYAPSPSGDLHLGNLRTAILAWLIARRSGRAFRMRIEDLDVQRSHADAAQRQLEDLAALGMDWDEPVMVQSERSTAHQAALDALSARGAIYECYCTRREIQDAPRAPHAPPGAYPGTCRNLTDAQREAGRARMRELHRAPALRLRAEVSTWEVLDVFADPAAHGAGTRAVTGVLRAQETTQATVVRGAVDDFVLRRGDGAVAYNLAVVVDDAAQGVDQVVRGDDLLSSAPRQAYLAHLLGVPTPVYAHVPLVLGPDGKRLAKRDGAVTLRDREALGESPTDVLEHLAASLGVQHCRSLAELLERWEPEMLPSPPWQIKPTELEG